jgi:putative transposase
LDSTELAQLQSMVRSRSIPAALRARGDRIGERRRGTEPQDRGAPGLHNATVGKWRCRFIERRLSGLYDELRPGSGRSMTSGWPN